jgi:hypothetical protein
MASIGAGLYAGRGQASKTHHRERGEPEPPILHPPGVLIPRAEREKFDGVWW